LKRVSGNSAGGIDKPLSLFVLSLFSLCLGGVITWYLLGRTPVEDIPDTASAETMVEETLNRGSDSQFESATSFQPASELVVDPISTSRKNAIVTAAERIGPSVVSINILQAQLVRASNPFFFDDFWNDFFFPRSYRREVQSLGSGFIISSEGHILTNEHVIRGGEEITVILEDGREFIATVFGSDRMTDLAVLEIEASDLPVTIIGSSRSLMIGEWVIAIGNPFGYLLDDTQPTVTVGVISAIERDIKLTRSGDAFYADMIQTDASINPGNSGGPLVNSRGEVIGVNTFIFTKSGGSLGIGFAVPIDRAMRVYNEILRFKKVLRPWVGIHPQDLTLSLRRGLNIEEDQDRYGVIVADVDPGSPADGVGIRRGDVILRINGESIRSAQDWEGILLDVQVENELKLEIYRDGRNEEIRFATTPLPTDTADKVAVDFGLVLTDVTEPIKSQLGLRSPAGALIVEVTDPMLSRDNGLEVHDVVLKVNDKEIHSAEEAKKALDNLSMPRNSLVLERGGRMIYRSLLKG
jgi:serine protease Do